MGPIPVTARLSLKFYERLGEDLATELVDWFNAVDSTYRNDLRDLNELNFTRFSAKLEQRFAEFDAKLERRFAESDAKLERRFAESDAEQRLADVRVEFHRELAATRAELIRWAFVFWIPTALGVIGFYFKP